MHNLQQMIWRRLTAFTKSVLSSQNPDDQKRLSWARRIESFSAVPAVYQSFFESFKGRAFPYCVLTPTFEGFLRSTTEKLVCDLVDEIAVLEKHGSTFDERRYPLEKINYVEVRNVLLDSRIKISGITRQGEPASSTFKFNSVTDYLFVPILERIRCAAIEPQGVAPDAAPANFDHWIREDYKFMNYARQSLLAGEKVIRAVLQPEIRVRAPLALGRRYRRLAPTHATILTDHELILIREDERLRASAKYSGIWDYIPLKRVVNLSLGEKGDDMQVLSIDLPERDHLEALFQPSAKQELGELIDLFARRRAMTPAV